MKAISIWQPHASLIVLGLKPFETRSWTAWKSLIGQRIWIHAGKALGDLQTLNDYLIGRDAGEVTDDVHDAFVRALKGAGISYLRDLPRGALLGSAILAECIPTEQVSDPGVFGDFSPGRYAWRMVDPIPLLAPCPISANKDSSMCRTICRRLRPIAAKRRLKLEGFDDDQAWRGTISGVFEQGR